MDEKYTYNGKEYSRADLEAKYGDKVDDAISKFGFELVDPPGINSQRTSTGFEFRQVVPKSRISCNFTPFFA